MVWSTKAKYVDELQIKENWRMERPRYLLDKDSICYGCKNYKHIDDVVTTQDIHAEDLDVNGGICNCGCFCESGSEYED